MLYCQAHYPLVIATSQVQHFSDFKAIPTWLIREAAKITWLGVWEPLQPTIHVS